MKTSLIRTALALLLFAVANHADYLLQAYQHNWPTWIDLSYRAPHWGIFDFVPHDAWHAVQFTRNQLLLLAPLLACFAFPMLFSGLHFAVRKFLARFPMWVQRILLHPVLHVFLFTALLYVLGRGAGFQLFRELMWSF